MTIHSTVHHLAITLIEKHGLRAPAVAAEMAEIMLRNGNLYERRTWRRVQTEVRTLADRGLFAKLSGELLLELRPEDQIAADQIPVWANSRGRLVLPIHFVPLPRSTTDGPIL